MNAPATAAALAKPTLEHIAIDKLRPSGTHIQALRRARFDKKALDELADSIRKVGLLQPIVAKPFKKSPILNPVPSDPTHIIVAGERRWLAAKQAGLQTVPVNVRELSDEEVLEVQLIENLQREGLHELEEAEGYAELMKLKNINADAVADMVGKSRSYVFARTKLLALCPEARKAFYAGELDASTALEIARIPPHDFQVRAMKDLEDWRRDGEVTNVREAQKLIREHYMVRLKNAVFDIRDAQLVPAAGSCSACPKNSANQADLRSEIKGADVCTDPKCFDGKRQAHYAGARKAQEAKGKKVIYGDQAKRILPHWEDGDEYMGHASPYRRLNDTVGFTARKVGEVLGKDYNTILIQHPLTGKFIEVATQDAIDKATKGKKGGGSSRVYGTSHTSWKPKPKAGPDVDDMLTDRLAELIHKKAPKQFGKAWLLALARELREHLSTRHLEAVAKAWGWPAGAFNASGYRRTMPKEAAKLSERDLVLLMFHIIFAIGQYTRADVLKLFGIKEPEIREQIIQERKAAAAKARAEAKAKKEAAKKPAPAAGKVGTKWPFPTTTKSPGQKAAKSAKPKSKAKARKKGKPEFLKPVQPKPALAAIVGSKPITRIDITKKLWGYIKRNGLQDKKERRMINADAKLAAVFGGKKRVSMFDMTQHVGKQLVAA